MNKFNVVLLKLPALYEILTEIKLELNFNLVKFNEINDEFKHYILKNPETLVISSSSKLKCKNLIIYNKVINIKSLLEQINIILSKINFETKSKVSITDYTLDINSRIISKKDLSLKLTEREVELLIYLNNSKHESSSEDLQKNVWKHSQDLETHTVETHIYRLRKKIHETFGDNNFILNTNKGYSIYK